MMIFWTFPCPIVKQGEKDKKIQKKELTVMGHIRIIPAALRT